MVIRHLFYRKLETPQIRHIFVLAKFLPDGICHYVKLSIKLYVFIETICNRLNDRRV